MIRLTTYHHNIHDDDNFNSSKAINLPICWVYKSQSIELSNNINWAEHKWGE